MGIYMYSACCHINHPKRTYYVAFSTPELLTEFTVTTYDLVSGTR